MNNGICHLDLIRYPQGRFRERSFSAVWKISQSLTSFEMTDKEVQGV